MMRAATVIQPGSLLGWVESPQPQRGVRTFRDGEWTLCDYATLAARVRGAAWHLTEEGVSAGKVVAICEPDCLGFITAFFATLYAGATPAPLPPRSTDPESLLDHITAVLNLVRPAVVVQGLENGTLVDEAIELSASCARRVRLNHQPAEQGSPSKLADISLLQFTSGSTGPPRGIRITGDNLEAQVQSVSAWHGYRPDDAFASWLPLHHDMGLAGLLLAAILTQRDLWQMRPEQFLMAPVEWLRCLDQGKATITAAPTFGYGYVARRVRRTQLQAMDFSGVRSAIVGAERLSPAPLRAFVELLAPRGLSARALRPAYGLAEATLAVTGSLMSQTPRTVTVDWATSRPGQPLPLVGGDALLSRRSPTRGAIVSSGRALNGVCLRIVDEEGFPVPECHLGEITVRSPSVGAGYLGSDDATTTRFDDPVLYTGDAGFIVNGELYVVGRIADSIKIRGRRVYAESIEQRIASDHHISGHRCLAIPSVTAGEDSVTILLEAPPHELTSEEVVRSVRAVTGPSVAVDVIEVDQGAMARTTSGKVQRRQMWQQLRSGVLPGQLSTTNSAIDEVPPALEKELAP